MEEEKEFIYVTKELAKKIKDSESEDRQLEVIQEYLNKTKKSMSGDLEAMEEDSIKFKGMLLSYKKAYKEALEAHSDAVYKIWEDIDGSLPNMKSKVEKVAKDIDSVLPNLNNVIEKINQIEDSINRFNVSELSDMVTLIERIEQSSENTKAILLKVLAK